MDALKGGAVKDVFPDAPGIAARFAEQVLRRPDAIAANLGDVSLTYAELDRRANRVANLLLAQGVGRDTLVGLCLDRSLDLLVGMLGIVKAGAAYLPLDLVYPRDRLAFMLEDAGAPVVLTLSRNRDALPDTVARIVCLDADPELAAASDAAPGIDHGPDALAYVIYTSGSTGKPKGCQVTQGNVVRLFTATEAWYRFDERDVWTFFHSHAFDFSVWEIWGALLYGGRVVVVPHATSRSPEAFRRLLVDERVTVLNQTPSAFVQLVHADAACDPADYALRYVIFGGEALELQALRPWFDRYGDARPQLVNMYGITETTVHVTYRPIRRDDLARGTGSVIGVPIPDLTLHVLDANLAPVPAGAEGELFVGGAGVSRGYLKRPDLTAQRFIDWRPPGCADAPPQRLYRTGDLVRALVDGDLEYLGRIDTQVKIRGFRIETGEIEAALNRHPAVRACAVVAREDKPGDKRLVAYVVPATHAPSVGALRAHLGATLPDYMVPAAFVTMGALPLTENGKLDRRALPAPGRERPGLSTPHEPAANAVEQGLCEAFGTLLEIDGVGRHDNFFELGGNSLLAVRLLEMLREEGHAADALPATLLFRHPTPAALAIALDGHAKADVEPSRLARAYRGVAGGGVDHAGDEPIAIIAMAGRFPGAATLEAFWDNLCAGRDSITHFRLDELDPSVSEDERQDPAYVPARGVIDGVEMFDAAFFGISPRHAELMDPQQRIFLELCWECLERGGQVPDGTTAPVGVFAGMYNASYFQRHVAPRPDLVDKVGAFNVMLDNEKDFIATRVAHKLNLTGPAISVHTACSTSLVAICQAVDSLRAGQCDMALAGGITVCCPPRSGYRYQEGAMLSPDGHTRTFDARAQGTVFSDGAAVVLLKRWSDARADGDPVYALIRGGALNNDGASKASFTAPSSEGQAAVVAMAHRHAQVDPRTIGYVEAHGTATPLGDPIEIEGLTKAFRRATRDTGFCRIGSVKSNVGHLVIAAGATGVMKTALALQHGVIPPTLHFESANPAIDFAASPFDVNTTLAPWPDNGPVRRAGVSSFGVGGTNAHVVMEEAPPRAPSDPAIGPQLLPLSARTPAALEQVVANLADHLEATPDANLADVAWTLAVGRKAFPHRIALVAGNPGEACALLRGADVATAVARSVPAQQSDVVFLFPGQGATYPGMGRGLYAAEPVFREAIDTCAEALRGEPGADLRERMFADDAEALMPTAFMQPATFAIEYALARLWLARGITPAAMVGHSVGEFVAATLAGVFTLPDALRLVARRGRLMQEQPPGSMLSVRIPADTLLPRLPADLSLAAENAPGACVVAGPEEAIARFQAELEADDVACRPLRTSHAFHSAMMEPVVVPFREAVAAVARSAPRIPIVSTVTGHWLDDATATSAEYWANHLREPVRFSAAMATVAEGAHARVLLEVGPRSTLCTLSRQHPAVQHGHLAAVPTLQDNPDAEDASVRQAAGQLWCHGVAIDLSQFDRRAVRQRLRLPTYPFERQRCWVDAALPARPGERPPVDEPREHVPPTPGPQVAVATPAAVANQRGGALLSRLRELFEDITGLQVAEADAEVNFMELGLDSLMLTQAALRIQKAFGVPVTFRQLMGEHASLARLAALLDARMPEVAPTVPATTVAATQAPLPPSPSPSPAVAASPLAAPVAGAPGNDAMCGLIEQQIALLAQQLALMRSGGPAPAPSVGSEAAAEPAAAPAWETQPPAVQAVLALMDAARPPVPGARIGRDPDGRPAWFIPNPRRRGHFLKVGA